METHAVTPHVILTSVSLQRGLLGVAVALLGRIGANVLSAVAATGTGTPDGRSYVCSELDPHNSFTPIFRANIVAYF